MSTLYGPVSGRFMHLLGCAQTGTSRNASNVTTEYPQTHQKSSALLWQEMAPMWDLRVPRPWNLLPFFTPANMKVITAIYLNCRPDLRDEWLTGNEMEEGQGAQVSEQEIFVESLNSFTGPRTSTAPSRQVLWVLPLASINIGGWPSNRRQYEAIRNCGARKPE